MREPIIAPSLLSCDFGRLAEEARAAEAAGADWLHLDVMDGRFVPPITFGPEFVAAARRAVTIPLDVHLMIVEPEKHLEAFIDAGADWLTVHVEATAHLHRCLTRIKDYGRSRGVRAGVSVNPHTPVESFLDVLDEVDLALVMTVNPGWGGQAFIPSQLAKIRRLADAVAARGTDTLVMVDGGIKPDTIAAAAAAGARAFVAGSAVFLSGDYTGAVAALRAEARRGMEAGA